MPGFDDEAGDVSTRAAVVEADKQLVRTGLIAPDVEGRDPPGIEEALGAFRPIAAHQQQTVGAVRNQRLDLLKLIVRVVVG